MSNFSSNLRLELIATGDQAGVWGNTTNTNLGTLLEAAVTAYTSVSVTSAKQALTARDGLPDEARCASLAFTTTTSADFEVYAPPAPKLYVVANKTAYAATIYNSTSIGNTTAAGVGVVVPAGKTMAVWTDGTNFDRQATHVGAVTGTFTGNVTGNVTGSVFATGSSTVADAKGDVRTIPQNAQSSGYTLQASDVGKHVAISSGNIFIPSGVFSAGDAITIYNNSATSCTVTCSAVTAYRAGANTVVTSVTLVARGLCTVLFYGSNAVVLSGTV